MFWKRYDIEDPQGQREEFRQALADRLKVALDFATLGAYELSGPDGTSESTQHARGDVPVEHVTEQPLRRDCRSERVQSRRHVTAAHLPCPSPEQARTPESGCGSGARRGGSVATAEQPCTWAEPTR
jgi:hypothetical protein